MPQGLLALSGALTEIPVSIRQRLKQAFGAVLLGSTLFSSLQAGAPDPATTPATSESQSAASPARVRLISQEQYANTLAYIFGPDIKVASHFAPFRRTEGLLEVGASSAGVTSGQMQEFQRTAGAFAELVVSPDHRNFLIPCTPKREDAADKRCATQFLSSVGRLLYRRPMHKQEIDELVTAAGDASNRLKDFYAGLAVALEGILVSPDMLFIIDRSEPDAQAPGQLRLDSYSLASRLSFFFWNAAPDDALLKMAERGDLQRADGRVRAVDYLLASPRLETGVRALFDDMLGFDDFAVLAKDPGIYPAFVGDAVQDAREQTLRTIVDHLIVRKLDYRDLFTTRQTFMSPSLATLYGVSTSPGWTPYEIPADSERIGLLTQIAFLASHAHPGRSSATLRGKALRELLLCQTVPRPPPNVDFSLIEDPKSTLRTARERLAAHRANPVCAGCHKITDPIGLALENFDGAGQYRDNEKGAAIDASGTLDGKNFTDPKGLAQAVHDNPAVPSCMVQRAYAYATGGSAKGGDATVLPYFNSRFSAENYRLPDLLKTIALSRAFSHVTASPPSNQVAALPAANSPTPVRSTESQGVSR
jgi:Protein of unknown function (DUF1588)/Protein of unknown function (DUF1592)/Protein of unknown function (DUF1595)/Protein of unknown function (DUF1585)